MSVRSFQDLIVWQKAMDLVETVYRTTSSFPKEEVFGLTAQLRRAATSIPSNIAEGQCRESTPDFRRFLSIARGSLGEAETQVLIAERLRYINAVKREEALVSLHETARLLNGLLRSLTHDRERNHQPLTTDH
jgi:four helix bundle protein